VTGIATASRNYADSLAPLVMRMEIVYHAVYQSDKRRRRRRWRTEPDGPNWPEQL